jgi:hypothetical protein
MRLRPANRCAAYALPARHERVSPTAPRFVGGALHGEAAPWREPGVWSDRSPYSVVPEPPNIGSRVPHQLSPGRPRRWRWLRRRPRRRGPPGSPARRTIRASRTLPVVAMIPVPVRDVAPARVPLITWAPVIGRRRGRDRPGPRARTASQSERGQSQPATHQHARRPPKPRTRLP